MHRDKFTEKLVRIAKLMDAGNLPMDVRELYVFGSYSRGAIEPGDLDLIVIHGDGIREIERRVLAEIEADPDSPDDLPTKCRKIEAAKRRLFRSPSERVQIIFDSSVERVTREGSKIKPSDPVLIWSRTDRDWEQKIAAIVPDATAGRAERNHLISLTRLHDQISTMGRLMEMIDRQMQCGGLNKIAKKCDVPQGTEIWSQKHNHLVDVGRPSLRRMIWHFERLPKLKRQCLIPHFKKGQPNDLLHFERGPNWADRESTKRKFE
jgi:predicted nucleotidyltransferase